MAQEDENTPPSTPPNEDPIAKTLRLLEAKLDAKLDHISTANQKHQDTLNEIKTSANEAIEKANDAIK